MAAAPTTQVDLLEAHDGRVHTGGLPAIGQASPCPVGLQPVQDTIEAFMLSRRVGNCSAATLRIYEANLSRFVRVAGRATPLAEVGPIAIQHYLATLRETMKPISADQHDRNLRTFFRWAVDAGLLTNDPMRGIPRPRVSLPLPDLPTEDELRAVLASCTTTFEGVRNRTIILVMADAGLRAGEVARARVQDWDASELRIVVRLGKGRRDRVAFVSPTTAEGIRRHLAMRPGVGHSNPLFADTQGRPLALRHLVQILHRLSARAGLPPNRRLHPHTLRHFAATSWLRNGVGLDHVRRLLGHTNVAMTLRYSSLVANDLQRAHREAAAIERVFPGGSPRRNHATPHPMRAQERRGP
jgi:integrase/recombinase XerD